MPKIAIAARSRELASEVDARFGRVEWFIVIDGETDEFEAYGNAVSLKCVQLSGVLIAR